MSLIELTGVSKIFHTDEIVTDALSEVDLLFGEVELLSIAGPSGCG